MNILRWWALQRGLAMLLVTAMLLPVLAGCASPTSRRTQVSEVMLAGIVVDGTRAARGGEAGLVRVVRDGSVIDGQAGMVLHTGDRIQTGPNADILIRFPSGSELLMRPNSRARIGSISEAVGEFFAKIKGVFAVETTFVRAGARGTQVRRLQYFEQAATRQSCDVGDEWQRERDDGQNGVPHTARFPARDRRVGRAHRSAAATAAAGRRQQRGAVGRHRRDRRGAAVGPFARQAGRCAAGAAQRHQPPSGTQHANPRAGPDRRDGAAACSVALLQFTGETRLAAGQRRPRLRGDAAGAARELAHLAACQQQRHRGHRKSDRRQPEWQLRMDRASAQRWRRGPELGAALLQLLDNLPEIANTARIDDNLP